MGKMYTVQQGDYLSKIAKKFGFKNWKTIYDHEKNSDFRDKRPNPNLIYPGDKIYIPDKQQKGKDVKPGNSYRYKIKKHEKIFLKLCFKNFGDENIKITKYELLLKGGEERLLTGENIDGLIELEIDDKDKIGELKLWTENTDNSSNDENNSKKSEQVEFFKIYIGGLDPIDTISGIQARLNNLNIDCGPVDGKDGPKTKKAIKKFQDRNDLKVDGIAGPKTQEKLEEIYGF